MNIIKASKGCLFLKNIVLGLSTEKGLFSHSFKISDYKGINIITVKERIRAVKKIATRLPDRNIIISHKDLQNKIYKNKVREYKEISIDAVTRVIEKVVRQCADKFGIKTPLCEIYIVASADIACPIIDALRDLSRLYTIVSAEESMFFMYDELYFKYGSVIRHISDFDDAENKDCIIINCTSEKATVYKTPVIDIYGEADASNTVSLKNIYVYGEEIEDIQKCWGGKSGLSLYALAEKTPGENAVVDIMRKCDQIFLLDTEEF